MNSRRFSLQGDADAGTGMLSEVRFDASEGPDDGLRDSIDFLEPS